MFETQVGGQVAWLLPAALILLVAGLWLTRRAPRTDLTRAALIMWGGWTVIGALVLSLMQGNFHTYYTLVLVPGIVGLVVIGGREMWRARGTVVGRSVLALTAAVTAAWSWELLDRTPTFLPWLRWTILALGLLVALALLTPAGMRGRVGVALVGVAVLIGAAGPAAYAVDTALTAHFGGGVSAGPALPGGDGFGRGGPAGRGDAAVGGGRPADGSAVPARGARVAASRDSGGCDQPAAHRLAQRGGHPLVGGHGRVLRGGVTGAGQPHRGDGHRGLHRLGPRAQPGPVPGRRRERPGALLRRRRRQRWVRWPRWRRRPDDHTVGTTALHPDDRRRHDRLQPHRARPSGPGDRPDLIMALTDSGPAAACDALLALLFLQLDLPQPQRVGEPGHPAVTQGADPLPGRGDLGGEHLLGGHRRRVPGRGP